MVLDNGAVKITDFGIALLPTGTRTLAGNVFGSPRYMSPEQVMGRTVDGRSDIFSLGAVLYEMLTGLPPFTGARSQQHPDAGSDDPTPAPSSHNRDVAARVRSHRRRRRSPRIPRDRYQDAQDMATDLRNFAGVELTSSAPGPLPPLEHPTVTGPAPALAEYVPAAEASRWARSPHPWRSCPVPPDCRANPGCWSERRRWCSRGGLVGPVRAAASRTSVPPLSPQVSGSDAGRSASAPIQALPASAREADTGSAPRRDAGTDRAVAAKTPKSEPASAAPMPRAAAPPRRPPPASPAVGARAADAKPAAPVAKPTGRVAFAVTPWGEVHVDGRMRGVSPPLQEIASPPASTSSSFAIRRFRRFAKPSTFPPTAREGQAQVPVTNLRRSPATGAARIEAAARRSRSRRTSRAGTAPGPRRCGETPHRRRPRRRRSPRDPSSRGASGATATTPAA